MTTGIEWTDETWNPTVGCSKTSPGCDGCYAIGVAHRAMQPAHEGLTIRRPGERPDWNGRVRCLPERLATPSTWRRPRRVFVDSMSDLFHPEVPARFVAQVFGAMAMAPQHTFQVLTKRPQRMAKLLTAAHFEDEVEIAAGVDRYRGFEWCREEYPVAGAPGWLPNVWLGTSIESDAYTFRADHLRATPAAVRFLSLEPLLGPLPSLDLTGIGWVIVGGESGPGARPMHPQWVREIRDRCIEAGVPFFFKQWGAWSPGSDPWDRETWTHKVELDGTYRPRPTHAELTDELDRTGDIADSGWHGMSRVGKHEAGRELDGRTWDEMPRCIGGGEWT